MYSIASLTTEIFSASSSGMLIPNSDSKLMINSTVSRESAPKSLVKLASGVTCESSTPSFSAIIAATFSVITPGGLVVNLLAVPIAVFSVILSVLGILFSYISFYLAGVFNSAAHMSTSIVLGLARTAGAIGWSNIEIEKWSLLECVVWYIVVALVLWIIHIYQSRPRVKF